MKILENYIVFQDENGSWLVTSDIAKRIQNGEKFEFNARLNDGQSDDTSTYKRMSSRFEKIMLKKIAKEK